MKLQLLEDIYWVNYEEWRDFEDQELKEFIEAETEWEIEMYMNNYLLSGF